VTALQEELKASGKALAAAREELAVGKATALAAGAEAVGVSPSGEPFLLLVARLDGVGAGALQTATQHLQEGLGAGAAVVLGGVPDPGEPDKLSLVAAFGPKVVATGLKAGTFIGAIARRCGGGGGGRPNLAQAGGRDGAALDGALDQAQADLKDLLRA
jgi:alanyl-tRNA synthetase